LTSYQNKKNNLKRDLTEKVFEEQIDAEASQLTHYKRLNNEKISTVRTTVREKWRESV